jgi:type II secretory pathway pseudopilin PulG
MKKNQNQIGSYLGASHRAPRHNNRGNAGGFTLIEMMVAFGLLLLSLSIATVAGKTVRADGRRATCVTNQASLFTAKRMAWEINESLNTVADPDGTVLAYLDSNNLPFCPNNGTHKPASGAKPTSTNTLASYDIAAATEATLPTCKIGATDHVKK